MTRHLRDPYPASTRIEEESTGLKKKKQKNSAFNQATIFSAEISVADN